MAQGRRRADEVSARAVAIPAGFAPFDPGALVVMLNAFYPAVSAAAFAKARAERAEYFGGGVIFGSKGDKLRLPDGREYDCIVAAGGPASARRWSCSLIDPTDAGDDDPFPLEDGPIEYADEDLVIFVGGDRSFEGIIADGLRPLDGADEVLGAAAQGAIEFNGAADLENSFGRRVEPAAGAHARIRAALENDNPADVIDATNRHDGEIDGAREDYAEPDPPAIDEPDPGPKPRDDDDDGGRGKGG